MTCLTFITNKFLLIAHYYPCNPVQIHVSLLIWNRVAKEHSHRKVIGFPCCLGSVNSVQDPSLESGLEYVPVPLIPMRRPK